MLRTLIVSLLVTAIIVLAFPAQADALNKEAVVRSASVTSSSSEVLAANKHRTALVIQNVCAQNVGISPTGTTAAIGTTGTIVLRQYDTLTFTGADVPTNALNGISASGTCALTVWEIR